MPRPLYHLCWIFALARATVCPSAATPDTIELISGGPYVLGEQPDGNTVIIRAPAGAIVVDTGRHPVHVEAIERALAASDLTLAAIINTHWHLDHVGGNPALRQAHPGVPVYATDAIQAALPGFLADYRRQLDAQLQVESDAAKQSSLRAERALIDAGQALAPDHVVSTSGPIRIAGRTLDVHLERHAHTDGDLWIVDRRTATVIAGDLVVLPTPFLDTSCAAGIASALQRIAHTRFERLIPGHGPELNRAEFDRYRRAFAHLLACAASSAAVAECAAGWRDDLGPLLPAADDPTADALIGYYLQSSLRSTSAQARWCGNAGAPAQ